MAVCRGPRHTKAAIQACEHQCPQRGCHSAAGRGAGGFPAKHSVMPGISVFGDPLPALGTRALSSLHPGDSPCELPRLPALPRSALPCPALPCPAPSQIRIRSMGFALIARGTRPSQWGSAVIEALICLFGLRSGPLFSGSGAVITSLACFFALRSGPLFSGSDAVITSLACLFGLRSGSHAVITSLACLSGLRSGSHVVITSLACLSGLRSGS